jgi:ABC-type transport system substrate-binding protein
MLQSDSYPIYPLSTLAFGYGAGDTPWKDERMRQAVSMLLDRELIVDVNGNRQKFADDGVDISPRYNSVVGPGAEGYWIDPQDSKKFGEWSKVYTFNVTEAKKLMSAAGYANGVDSLLHYNGGTTYGAAYTRTAELLQGMLSENGVRAKLDPREYQNDWVPNYHYGYTKGYDKSRTSYKGFTGIIYRAITGYPTVPLQVFSVYNSGAIRFQGMTTNGQNAQDGDPAINDLTNKIRREFDVKKQQEMTQELQRTMAKLSYDVPFPYAALGVGVYWPVIGNLGAFRGAPAGSAPVETTIHWWIDTTKEPLAKG